MFPNQGTIACITTPVTELVTGRLLRTVSRSAGVTTRPDASPSRPSPEIMKLHSARYRLLAARAACGVSLITAVVVSATCSDTKSLAPRANSAPENQVAAGGLTITPGNDTTLVGQTIALRETGAGAKLATWSSSDSTIAAVASTGATTAAVTGRAPGVVTITATVGNHYGTATVHVLPVPVRSVTIAPDSSTGQIGDSVQFVATPRDSAGHPLSGRSITWSTPDTTVASVSATGMAHARAHGTAHVRAVAEGVVGQSLFIVSVPELAVPALSARDSVNVGDTLTVGYSIQNLGDTPIADSIIVRVGLRSSANVIVRGVRRALPRLTALGLASDSTRILIPSTSPGAYTAVVYVDCRDVPGATDEARLSDCLATPAAAGTIIESNENNNSSSKAVIVRGPQLTASALAAPDTVLTRTTVTASLTVTNAGSATPAGFDVIAGLFDVTTSTVIAAATTSVPVLGNRATGVTNVSLPIPGGIELTHQYQIRAYADCTNSGTTPAARLQTCLSSPGSPGVISESNENDNSASRAAIVLSNVARVNATPDTVRFVSIGDTASLSATAFDRSNAVVSGVTVTWASLDSAASVTAAGVVHSVGSGTARIVATIEGRSDTSIVIVAQQVASVVATPDTALIAAGGSVSLTAVLRDAAGAIMTTVQASWTSLDPTVATVNGSGSVSGVSAGTARVVASANGHADTSIVFVNPTGYTHRWLGVNALGWGQPANWYPHTVPSQNTDSPFIPAGTAQSPYLVDVVFVRNIKVAAGQSLDLRNYTLAVFGNADAAGSIVGGTVEMRNGGSICGTLPTLTIRAPSQLSGRTSAAVVNVQDSARVTINGHTLVTSSLSVSGSGSVIESNPLDTVWVTSDALFNSLAPTLLSAGVLRVDGSFSNYGPPGSFVASGSHTTMFAGGSTQQFVTLADTTSTSGFQNIVVLNTQAGVQVQTTMAVKGLLTLGSGARLSSPGRVRFLSRLPHVTQGVYNVSTTALGADLSLAEDVVLPVSTTLTIDDGVTLNLNGHKLDISTFSPTSQTSRLVMPGLTPAESLIVRGSLLLLGGAVDLRGGVIAAYGDVTEAFTPIAAMPTGAKLALLGTRAHLVGSTSGDSVKFGDVDVADGGTVTSYQHIALDGLLTLGSGSTLALGQNEVRVNHALPAVELGTLNASGVVVRGSVRMNESRRFPSSVFLRVASAAQLQMWGHTLDVGGRLLIDGGDPSPGVLIMNSVLDSLITRGEFDILGQTIFSAGRFIAQGDVIQGAGSPSLTADPDSGHTTVLAGTAAQRLQLSSPATSYFNNLEIDNPAGVDISSDIQVHGQLLGTGAGVVRSTNASGLNVTGGILLSGLVFDGSTLSVSGPRGTMNGVQNLTFQNSPTVPALLRIRYDGYGEFYLFNTTFLSTPAPGTYWIDADSIDPAAGPITFHVSSPQAAQGPAYTRTGNAVVRWSLQ